MQRNKQADYLFYLGFFILSWINIMLLVASATFFMKFSLSWIHFPLSLILTAFLIYLVTKSNSSVLNTRSLKFIFYLVLLISVCFFISNCIFDVSFDGQWYHQDTIIQLKKGWNPIYSELKEPSLPSSLIYINTYTKGAEILEATVYKFFNKIEIGKSINILLLIASFSLSASFLLKQCTLSISKTYFISLLLAFNPIVLVQLFTYSLDGQLASLLLCFLILCASYIMLPNFYTITLIALTTIILINLKFTGLIFTAILCMGLLLYLLAKKKYTLLRKFWVVFVISFSIGVFVVGFNPYVTNTLKHKNPFYPLLGAEKIDILKDQTPKGLYDHNRTAAFIISIFSRTDNIIPSSDHDLSLKVPFTFSLDEIKSSGDIETRVGGFGFLFSGIFVTSLLSLIFIILSPNEHYQNLLLWIILTLVASIFIISASWWARYIPQLWYIPIIIFLFSELHNNKLLLWVRRLGYTLLFLNVFSILVIRTGKNIVSTQVINFQMRQLKSTNEIVAVDFKHLQANKIRFIEMKVPFYVKTLEFNKELFKIYKSETLVQHKEKIQNIPEPWTLRFAKKDEINR